MAKKKTSRRSTRQRGPEKVSVTMYNVGFGDCLMLTFHYAHGKDRRILFDCGSSEKKSHMSKVVDKIISDSGGHVDAIVATHRHADHISTFGLKGLGKKLESLNPDVVIQPWTEHLDAKKDALKAPSVFRAAAAVKHMTGLKAAEKLAQAIVDSPQRLLAAAEPSERKYLTRIASLSISNKKAVRRLAAMGKKHAYVYAGSRSGLERLLPGVRVSVLGPPTLEQCKKIRTQTPWDPDEFWKLRVKVGNESVSNAASACGHSVVFPDAKTSALTAQPSYVKWVTRNVDTAQFHNVRRIVQAMDSALNNTSVILLFETGKKTLLFSGDAQLESWQYALSVGKWKRRLRNTTVYKVGHHGSTNATPKTLWNLFEHRSTKNKQLITLLSTEKGHHNKVPRKSLIDALRKETVLQTTERWRTSLSKTYII